MSEQVVLAIFSGVAALISLVGTVFTAMKASERAAKDRQVEELKELVSDLTTRVDDLRKELNEERKDNAALRVKLKEQDDSFVAIAIERQEMRVEIEKLRGLLSRKENKIDHLKRELDSAKHRITELEKADRRDCGE